MRILIYGAGVIGSIFAGKLGKNGNEITVLARGNRLKELKTNGIVLEQARTKIVEKIPINIIESLQPEDNYDYIIVTMQRTQVDKVLEVLANNCTKNIVFVVNTATGYDKWTEVIGKERLMIGFPSAGGERINGKVSYFIGKGIQRVFQTTTFGELNHTKTKRVKTLIKLFNEAKIPSVFCKDMDAWQKTHVSLVTSIANALYGFKCNNYELGRSYQSIKQMVKGIKEGRRVLRIVGIKPTPSKLLFLDFPTVLLTIIFSIFMRTKLAETTMAKHCAVAYEEMYLLQQQFDELIEISGTKTPSINQLKVNLEKFHQQ